MKSTSILLTTSSLLVADLLGQGATALSLPAEGMAPASTSNPTEQAAEDGVRTVRPIVAPQAISAPENIERATNPSPIPSATSSLILKPYAVDSSSMLQVANQLAPATIAPPVPSSTGMEFSGRTNGLALETIVPNSPSPSTGASNPPEADPQLLGEAEDLQPLKSELESDSSIPDQPSTLDQPNLGASTSPDNGSTTSSQAQTSGPVSSPTQVVGLQPIANQKVHPLMTTLPLNGQVINHQTAWDIRSDYNLGSGSNNYLGFSSLYRWGSQVRQGFSSNNVFSSEFSGTYSQFQTLRTQRVVEVNRNDPHTMLGLTIQMTLTGACAGNGNLNDTNDTNSVDAAQCTLLPPLVTDRNSINELFLPTRIDQPGKLGDPVSAETLKILSQPGFQNVGADGNAVGLDLYFPNIGTIPDNESGRATFYNRSEQVNTTSLTGYSRVFQVLQANDTEAVLGVTVRGAGLVWNQSGALLNSLVGVATEALPTIVPRLRGGKNPANTDINLNLFRAANTLRLPENSWTFYQAQTVNATHNHMNAEGHAVSPAARSFGVWVGLSPVTKRELVTSVRYQTIGPETVLAMAGAEGGAAEDLRLVTNTNGTKLDTDSMRNFYAQIYLTFLKRDVNLVVSDRLTETTTYQPHVSLSGTVTDANQSLRYYGGLITGDNWKPYAGADYALNGKNWGFNVGGIGYLNPDRDYFSHVRLAGNYAIPTGNDSGLVLATGMRYAFSQTSNSLDQPVDNFVNVGARFQWGSMSLGLTQYFGDLLPQSIGNATGMDASVNLGAVSLQGFYTPSNNQASYGVLASYRLGDPRNNLGLAIGWRRDTTNLGTSPSNNALTSGNDVFTLQFRLGSQS